MDQLVQIKSDLIELSLKWKLEWQELGPECLKYMLNYEEERHNVLVLFEKFSRNIISPIYSLKHKAQSVLTNLAAQAEIDGIVLYDEIIALIDEIELKYQSKEMMLKSRHTKEAEIALSQEILKL